LTAQTDAAQERGLAAAGRPDDAQDFLPSHVQIEIAEGDDAAVEEQLGSTARHDGGSGRVLRRGAG
jgi:hypothetical protein